MFGYIYEFLVYMIKEKFIDIKHIDLFNNQYENAKESDSMPYPSVLIDIIPNEEFKQHSNKMQSCIVTVDLYLGSEFSSSLRANNKDLTKAIDYLKLVDKLFIGLEGVSNNDLPQSLRSEVYEIGTLHRQKVELLNNFSTLKVSKTSFIFKFADISARNQYIMQNLNSIDILTKIA